MSVSGQDDRSKFSKARRVSFASLIANQSYTLKSLSTMRALDYGELDVLVVFTVLNDLGKVESVRELVRVKTGKNYF